MLDFLAIQEPAQLAVFGLLLIASGISLRRRPETRPAARVADSPRQLVVPMPATRTGGGSAGSTGVRVGSRVA